jgi:cytochrome c oxidase subunit 2
MSEPQPAPAHAGSDRLLPWLVGGLIGGAIVLGLLIAAYQIGYNRGQDHANASAAKPTQTSPTTTSTTQPPGALGPVTSTPALVARGKALYTSNGCIACHSLTGAAGAGPSLKGVAGSQVTLADGSTVTADDSYLEQSITDADAQIVQGYRAGVMPAAIQSFNLPSKPDDVRALVAFIKSQK